MDRLPLEMWTAICSHACTDGGSTGCALAVTSRYLRSAVLPVQLQSVAINDVKHAARFLKAFKARHPRHRRVLYLFLSNVSKSADGQPHGWNELRNILRETLTLVAPDLRMLTDIIMPRGLKPHSLPNVPFPALEELTIHGSLLTLETIHHSAEPYDQLSFPSLKFLHYVSQWEGVEMYTSRAPVLTHLRLSGITGLSTAMRDALYQVLQEGDHSGDHHGDPSDSDPALHHRPIILSSSLERIIVEPDTTLLRFRMASNKLESLHALKNADVKRKLVVLRADEDPKNGALRHVLGVRERGYWDERLVGRVGCWSVPSEAATHRQDTRPTSRRRGVQFLGL